LKKSTVPPPRKRMTFQTFCSETHGHWHFWGGERKEHAAGRTAKEKNKCLRSLRKRK